MKKKMAIYRDDKYCIIWKRAEYRITIYNNNGEDLEDFRRFLGIKIVARFVL